jgi:hypothetical protein
MAATCAFCGRTGKLTGEHVLGDWLSRIGLDLDPVAHVTGPLNRMRREVGVTPPFRRTVRDVCGPCNNGWMSQLEDVARRTLTPFILGEPGRLAREDQGAIAAWLQKTALVAMLVSSGQERGGGYGLPSAEYRALYDQRSAMEPLPASQAWIGRYSGESRVASIPVTPLVVTIEGLPEPELPQAYAMTVLLGELLLTGVRFTTPGLQLDVTARDGFAQLWPAVADITWPPGEPVDDAEFLPLATGKNLRVTEPHLALRPWKPAIELAGGQLVGSMVELPTICGKHVVYYPRVLVDEAMRGRFYGFMSSCECGTAYIIETEADGAHCKAAGTPEAIGERYKQLPGEEYVIEDEGGKFTFKRLADRSRRHPR